MGVALQGFVHRMRCVGCVQQQLMYATDRFLGCVHNESILSGVLAVLCAQMLCHPDVETVQYSFV